MALNSPWEDHGASEYRSRFGSDPMHSPSRDELARLQELLAQALKREAEAHRKMKHMYDQLVDIRSSRPRSLSDALSLGSQNGTLDLWDSELSQASEASAQSPPPALIVSGSPKLPNKDTGGSLSFTSAETQDQTLSLQQNQSSQLGAYSAKMNGNCTSSQLDSDQHDRTEILSKNSEVTTAHLAPSPQDYRGVKQERERPPPSPPPPLPVATQSTTTTTFEYSDVDSRLIIQSPAQHSTERRSSSHSLQNIHFYRSSSIKEKRKDLVLPQARNRSNTSHFLSYLMRRRKSGGGGEGGSATLPQKSSLVLSFDVMFEHFVQSTSRAMLKDKLAIYIDRHWSEVCNGGGGECDRDVRLYRDAVWDLFQAEVKFLTRFLQPLENVYKGFLEELHFHGILKIADIDKIFANLSELCELSSSVTNDLFKLFVGRSGDRIAPNNELILAFSMFGHKFNPVYQRFCVNFEKQRGFVRALEKVPDFAEYLRVCRTHEAVAKNDLSALLIAPMQHQCRYQIMLEKVLKYTKHKSEKDLLSSAIKAFVVSLKELEANIEESKRSAELLELQETLCWPSLAQLDPCAYIPESLGSRLSCTPCGNVLASKGRQLVYRGPLKLMDNKLRPPREIVVFLFTDLLLLTQQAFGQGEKKVLKKDVCMQSNNQLMQYCVIGHPVFLNMLDIHNVPFAQNHGYLITLIERNSFQQEVGVYSLQMANKEEKAKWMSQLTQTKSILWHRTTPGYTESDV